MLEKINNLQAFVLFILLFILFSLIMNEFIINDGLIYDYFASFSTLENINTFIELKNRYYFLFYFFFPVIYILKFIFLSLWLLSASLLFNKQLNFNGIFKIVILAEFVKLIPVIISIIWFGMFNENYSLVDIQLFKPISLLSLFKNKFVDEWLILPLSAINIFEMLYLLFLTIGIKYLMKSNFKDSFNFSVPVYGSVFLIWIVFITFININLSI